MSIVSSFSWDLQWSEEKTKTMLTQNLRGKTKSIMVFSEVAYDEDIASFMLSIELNDTCGVRHRSYSTGKCIFNFLNL